MSDGFGSPSGKVEFIDPSYQDDADLCKEPLLQRVNSMDSNKNLRIIKEDSRPNTDSSELLDEDKFIETAMIASVGSMVEGFRVNPWNKTFLKAHHRFSKSYSEAQGCFGTFMFFMDWPIQFIIDCTIPPVDKP